MPELPEVETIKSQLQTILPFKINECNFSINSTRLIKSKDFDLTNKEIISIERTGKWLIFQLKHNGFLLSHLGMSGSWQMGKEKLKHKHGHIEFIQTTKNKFSILTYVDPRRFGHFYILNNENFLKKMSNFPIDITHPDFDKNYISEQFFKNPNKTLKPFLLDQKVFFGIGNYMASEICARARLLPTVKTGDLSDVKIEELFKSIKEVVDGAISSNGTTFSGGYVDANGEKGEGVRNLLVFYQTECQICKGEGRFTKIIKTQLQSRGTYHCPYCQKAT